MTRSIGGSKTLSKERPKCRAYIIKERLSPHMLRDSTGVFWDGRTATRPNGERTALGGGLIPQMRLMIREGFFGEEAMRAVLDITAYYCIRERLEHHTEGPFGVACGRIAGKSEGSVDAQGREDDSVNDALNIARGLLRGVLALLLGVGLVVVAIVLNEGFVP